MFMAVKVFIIRDKTEFSQNAKKYMQLIKKRHKGKLDPAKNQIENYLGNRMSKEYKKISNQILRQKDEEIEKQNQFLKN
ncbi:hypothetical protein MBORA_07990 [Methanobrevibacter oralis]|uniref:Uncharacterized protein n=2 Tax=Methanobrevibacter oralis TaxID=66851 RepID=A0A166BEU7_METOA|nr:hypothetical protein MBORA_07990 [Methanobrevibacter oralis]